MRIVVPFGVQRIILFSLVTIAMILSGSATLLQVTMSHTESRSVECNALYNRLSGEARDERQNVDANQTKADLTLWRNLKRQFKHPTGTTAEQTKAFFDALDREIKALQRTSTVRLRHPYPDPDSCRDGIITEKEGNTS